MIRPPVAPEPTEPPPTNDRQKRFEAWKKALVESKGNVSQASRTAGIHVSTGKNRTSDLGLRDFANKLRYENGGSITIDGVHAGRVGGRPKKR